MFNTISNDNNGSNEYIVSLIAKNNQKAEKITISQEDAHYLHQAHENGLSLHQTRFNHDTKSNPLMRVLESLLNRYSIHTLLTDIFDHEIRTFSRS